MVKFGRFKLIRYKTKSGHNDYQIPNYFEVYLSTPLEVCEKRDPKGLYQKARLGEIKNFTGIGQEYETPKNPDFKMDTSQMSVSDSLMNLLKAIDGPISS